MPLASIWVCPPLSCSLHASSAKSILVFDLETSCFACPLCRCLYGFATDPALPTGTTYSCVATYEGNNVEIIANEQGSFTTPSFVSFTDKERLIGEAAKNNAAMNPRNTVFDAK